jgi:hypothetical protein
LVIPPFLAALAIVKGPPNTRPDERDPPAGLANKQVASATPTLDPILLFVAVTGTVKEHEANNPVAAMIVKIFFIVINLFSSYGDFSL